MDLVVYDDDEKRYVPWAVALAGVLLVALVTAGLTFLLARQASGQSQEQAVGGSASPAPASAPSAGSSPAPPCVEALQRADAALERSASLDEALAEHTSIMDELLAERIDAAQALDRALPVLTEGATQRERFEQELSAYTASREQCSG